MPAKRLSMRKIKEVLHLKQEKKMSNRKIADVCGVARSTVGEYLRGAEVGWPIPDQLKEADLEKLLFPPQDELPVGDRGAPDWNYINKEVEGHYYSLPHTLAKKQLEARITQNTIECFHRGERVTSHPRSYQKDRKEWPCHRAGNPQGALFSSTPTTRVSQLSGDSPAGQELWRAATGASLSTCTGLQHVYLQET